MSKHVAGTAEAELSPKVKAGAWVGAALLVAQVVLAAVTPEHFAWAGEYSSLFYAAVTGIGVAVAAYLKRDPLREVGGSAVAAGGVVPAFPAGAVGDQEAVGEESEPAPAPVSAPQQAPDQEPTAGAGAPSRATRVQERTEDTVVNRAAIFAGRPPGRRLDPSENPHRDTVWCSGHKREEEPRD